MASDVASQGGGAGQGRDRFRQARSAVRAGWRGGRAPRLQVVIRARSSRPGPQGRFCRGSRQGREVHPRILWQFHWRILGSSAARQVPEWVHQLGVSPLTVEGRDPVTAGRVTSSVPGLARETRYTEWTWPERLERLSERLRTLAKIKALRPKRPDRPPRRRKELRARTPPGVPTRADPDGANREQGH
jgi:hypothetical protein